MATCNTLNLLPLDGACSRSIGGIKRLLIAKRNSVTVGGTKIENTESYEEITSITLASGEKFYEWTFRPNTASYTSTFSGDNAIGNTSVTTEVSLQFSKAETSKRLAIISAINANSVVILQDMFGQWVYLGVDNPVYITAGTMQSGTAATDLNGFQLTFTDTAMDFPPFVSADVDMGELLEGAV